MILWLDAQLSPHLAPWIRAEFAIDALHIRDLSLRDAEDPTIFHRAREANAAVVTKDRDFISLLERLGPPPKVIWVTCGNTSNERLRSVFSSTLTDAFEMLRQGEILVEISEPLEPV